MRKEHWYVVLVMVALVSLLVQGCAPKTTGAAQPTALALKDAVVPAKLKVSDITFNDNYPGPGSESKPDDGFYAAKWWKGQPQVVCYKNSNRDKLPAATLQVIIDYLSANRPQTAADMAHENFARREFRIQ